MKMVLANNKSICDDYNTESLSKFLTRNLRIWVHIKWIYQYWEENDGHKMTVLTKIPSNVNLCLLKKQRAVTKLHFPIHHCFDQHES